MLGILITICFVTLCVSGTICFSNHLEYKRRVEENRLRYVEPVKMEHETAIMKMEIEE